jgi:nucleoside-diphosphate-sugar epimerase
MRTKQKFWRNRRCIVTGGVGFIGSHLCSQLHELGAEVIAVDRERVTRGTLFWHLNRTKDIEVVEQDISSPSGKDVIAGCKPDFIFHLAAEPFAPFTSQYPLESYLANVVTTVNALEAARECGAESFILASSACVFGTVKKSPLKPNDKQVEPEHYYSITKREAEAQVRIFSRLYGLGGVICRFGNVYGPGDRHFGRIVPRVCREVLLERKATVKLKRSSGQSIFEFLFVSDAVEGMIFSAENAKSHLELFQFSGGVNSRKSVRCIAEMTSEMIDGERRPVQVNQAHSERTVVKFLDTSDAERRLNWKPSYTLASGLKLTVDWYRQFIGQLTPREV